MGFWRSVLERGRKFRRLSAPDRLLFLQAMVMVSCTTLALRCLGFRRWHATLNRFAVLQESRTGKEAPGQRRSARRLAALVCGASNRAPAAPTCLHRSLTLWWLLRRQGLPGDLRIGVRTVDRRLEAHAWVEYRGEILNDRQDVGVEFTPFDRAIEPRRAVPA
jgi:hypothetical protein